MIRKATSQYIRKYPNNAIIHWNTMAWTKGRTIRHNNINMIVGSTRTIQHFIKEEYLFQYNPFSKLKEINTSNNKILSCSMISSKNNNKQVSMIHNGRQRIIKTVIHKIMKHVQRLWDILMVLFRTTEIGIRFSPLVILTPAAILASKRLDELISNQNSKDIINTKHKNNKNNTSIVSDITWKYTLYTIQKLGPAFIKISQWAATRRDIFPSHVCDRLSELNDATFLHSWKHTHSILTKSLGNDYADRLNIHENDIIGSGSVAQVYSGIWTNSNSDDKKVTRRVAVKILHPNIHHRVERDLLLMKRAASIIGEFSLCIITFCFVNLIYSIKL